MDIKTAIAVGLSVNFAIIIIILASLYGADDGNCDSFYAEKDAEKAAAALKAGPAMVHMPQIKNTKLTKLTDTDANAWVKTIGYSTVGSADMQATVLKVDQGPALMYTHWYEGIMMVMSGSFKVSNGTGQTFNVVKGQAMYIPAGAEISYSSNADSSYMYIVDQPPVLERSTAIQKAIDANSPSIGYPTLRTIPTAMSLHDSLAYFGGDNEDRSYLTDYILSNVTGAQMSGGLYKLLKGPHLDYTYE